MKKTRFFLWIQLILGCAGWLFLLKEAYLQGSLKSSVYFQQQKVQWNVAPLEEKEQNVCKENAEEYTESENRSEPEEQLHSEKTDKIENMISSENPRNIRVVLMDDSYCSYYHNNVLVEADGKRYHFSNETKEPVTILSSRLGGIHVLSLNRNGEHPVYDGTLEIRKEKEGFLIINELPLEEYLKSVVPSEMPAEYELEALKAQAICARTYALKQIEEKRMVHYYADVDDSAACQVYRAREPQEKTSKAVEDTAGQVLKCEDSLIEAYYFSTSSGMTSTDEIWGNGAHTEYLKSVSCAFDETFPWRHWIVSIPWENLELFLEETYGNQEELLDVKIQKKNQSGAVTELVLTTTSHSFSCEGEYEVREALSPEGCKIMRKDGEELDGGKLLPSAYFSLQGEKGVCVNIEGSGYGHGVGMSQTAANEMANEGYLFDEILYYFYQNIEIEIM